MKQIVTLNSDIGVRAILGTLTAVAAFALIGCASTPPPAPAPTAAPDSTIGAAAVPTSPPAATGAQPAPQTASTVVAPAPSEGAPVAQARNLDAKTVATAAALTPAGQPRYSCVNGSASNETRTPIILPTGSDRVCSRFPAMGPCQYERNACRAKGGRVIRFDDVEITKDVEREYDKQVQRFRLNAG